MISPDGTDPISGRFHAIDSDPGDEDSVRLVRCAGAGCTFCLAGPQDVTTTPVCTGLSATWCPIHGDCTCPYENDDPQNGRTLDDPTCPLHCYASNHAGKDAPPEENDAREAGFSFGEVDSSGELRLELFVNGHKGDAWLSREMWERIGEVAGWRAPPSSAMEETVDRELPPEVLARERRISFSMHIEKKFKELAAAWVRETGHLSNHHKRIQHPLYRQIVGLGWPVVPFLLEALAGPDPDPWGPALRDITGEGITIAPEDHGKVRIISDAWLALAKKKGWR